MTFFLVADASTYPLLIFYVLVSLVFSFLCSIAEAVRHLIAKL